MLWINGLQATNEDHSPLVMSKEDIDRIFGLILNVVHDRSNTLSVGSIKRVVVQELIANKEGLGGWIERIGHYVDSLEFE